jgi:hypothetical protein
VGVVAVANRGLPPPGAAAERADVAIVTHRHLHGGPAAIVGGTLRVAEGWPGLDNLDSTDIPSWPEGTAVWLLDGTVVVADAFGKVAASLGEDAYFGDGTDFTLNAWMGWPTVPSPRPASGRRPTC